VLDKKISQIEFVRSYFIARPMEIISHERAKADLETAYLTVMGKRLEDSDRAIRKLYGEGFLEKIAKGQYRYNPDTAGKKEFIEFSQSEKNEIFKRDGYKCVVCGLGRENGLELHVDHIKPRSSGGEGVLENGQTLCGKHNYLKKNFTQTETGKKSFIRLLELVEANPDDPNASTMEAFVNELLDVYDKYEIDTHIDRAGNVSNSEESR
jgi:hypothetical protein